MSEFLSCDWGTSSLRLRLVDDESLRIIGEVSSNDGAARIQRSVLEEVGDGSSEKLAAARADRFEAILIRTLRELAVKLGKDLDGERIVISGMATSTIGWRELPYGTLPLRVDGAQLPTETLPPIGDGQHPVLLVSGLREAADILRGEETQILGVLDADEYRGYQSAGLIILPGTHSKHVRVKDGQLVGFQTFMTGELFEVMSQSSILRNSVHAETLSGAWWDAVGLRAAFDDGVVLAAEKPLSGALFSVRARQVLERQSGGWCAAYLSGLLVGAELAAIQTKQSADLPVLICAAGNLVVPYRLAADVLGLHGRVSEASAEVMEASAARGQRLLLGRV